MWAAVGVLNDRGGGGGGGGDTCITGFSGIRAFIFPAVPHHSQKNETLSVLSD